MNISSSFNGALTHMQNGFENLQKNASQIASASSANASTASSGDLRSLTELMVGLKSSEIQIKASAEAVQAYDEALGSLIDVIA